MEAAVAALPAQLAQRLGAVDATEDGVQRLQAGDKFAQFLDRRRLRSQQGALAGPAQRSEQVGESRGPGRRQLPPRRGARGRQQRIELRQQLRRLQTSRPGEQPADRRAKSLETGLGWQTLAQPGFDARAGVGFVDVCRPARTAKQHAEIRLRDAPRAGVDLQQAQGSGDQRLRSQRLAADVAMQALLRRPGGADGIALQCIGQRGVEQAPARRQVGDRDAQAQPPVAGPGQARRSPGRRRQAFAFRIGKFDGVRGRRGFVGKIDAKEFHAALFQHPQQVGNHGIGDDETGQADAPRKAAQTALDAGDAPGEDLVHAAPAAVAASRREGFAPAPEGQVFAAVQGFGYDDAPGALQARRLHRRQGHALAIEEFGGRPGVRGDGLFPEIAFLHPAEETAGRRIGRKFPAEQGPRYQRVEPQRRRRTLQRTPDRRAARRLQLAMRRAQAHRQPRRGAQHDGLRPAGQVGQRHRRQIGSNQGITPPAAASARPRRTGS